MFYRYCLPSGLNQRTLEVMPVLVLIIRFGRLRHFFYSAFHIILVHLQALTPKYTHNTHKS